MNETESFDQLIEDWFENDEQQVKVDDIVYQLSNPLEEEHKQSIQKTTKHGKDYRTLKNIVNRLNDINWLDSSNKINPLKSLSPITFWFIVCCHYFPRKSDIQSIYEKQVKNIQKLRLNEKIEFDDEAPYSYRNDEWLKEQGPNTDLDKLIQLYEAEQNDLKQDILPRLTFPVEEPIQVEYDEDDVLKDLVGFMEIEKEYLNYLEDKQHQNKPSDDQKQKSITLAGTARKLLHETTPNCQICNENAKADNIIIICSKCNIQVHKKCYGLDAMQSSSNWICDICLNFGSLGRYVRCPLCARQGGAMKQTSLYMSQSFFEYLNPSFHHYAQANKVDRQKPPADNIGLYYDFMTIQHQYDVGEPVKSEFIWAHICCMNLLDSDLCLIDKKKYNMLCSICKTKKTGACVQCPSCIIAFHPECARRAQMFMDQGVIYCYKHQPLKLKRVLDNKHHTWNEEIQLFFKQYGKLEQLLSRKPNNHELEFDKIEQKALQLEIESEIKAENEELLTRIQQLVQLQEQFIITIEKNKVTQIQLPIIRESIYDMTQDDPIWAQLENEKYKSDQIYILYQRAIRMRKKKKQNKFIMELEELPLRVRKSQYSRPKIFKQFKRKHQSNTNNNNNNNNNNIQHNNNHQFKIKIPKEAITTQYCVCRQPFRDGDEMMQCEYCKEWYHLGCIGFNHSIEEAQSINFYCFQCENRLNKEQTRQLKKNKQYFIDPTFRDAKLMIGMSPHELRIKEKKNYKSLSKL